jgi:SAM-dependent methyltransferase
MSTFDEAYLAGAPPWDIGAPQPEVVRLEESGEIVGSVLDAGCGTGENALFLTQAGHQVWGIDSAPTAIERARQKAAERGLAVTFRVADVLRLEELGRTFDTILDCGLFHVFADPERVRYVESLRTAAAPGSRYLLLCFSDREPPGWGPRRVTEAEIRDTFRNGWQVEEIRPAVFQVRIGIGTVQAWQASIVAR